MCGIAGVVHTDGSAATPDELRPMLARLGRRGPDGQGTWTGGPCGLAHARLAIIDLAGGAQPLANEDESVWISFNGEIYDYRALRAELEPRHRFRTRSDTEVLVHLYEEEGPRMLARLGGFFAFALWDARAARLLLARDRLGKKPLYFAERAGRFLFASEPKALLAGLGESPELDPAALNDALALRYVARERSGFRGIEKLLPGELLVLEGGRARRERWWTPPELRAQPCGLDDAAGRYRELFDAAVARRLESEVPLGLLLSGGIDSTAVLESMARAAGGRVRTFTVAFSRERESEGPSAALAARYLGSDHAEFALSESDLIEHVERALPLLDEPFADPSFLPTALICERARSAVTVCLTGDGGDELFGGYTRYARAADDAHPRASGASAGIYRWLLPRLPRHRLKAWKLARSLARALATPEERAAARLISTEAPLRAELFGERARGLDLLEPERRLVAGLAGEAPLVDRMMALDRTEYLPGLILTKADRASMSFGLELRSPFLDPELLAFSAALPREHKLGPAGSKLVVRRALEGRVPRELLERRKRGFGTPLGRWFRRELTPQVERYLLQSRLAADGWLDARAVAAAVGAHRARARNLGELLWALLALEVWYRTWVAPS